jgi:hypothetical protein
VLARRVAVAAWRLARADRIETELFEERSWGDGGVGIALIRDGNGTRSFETLLRYRGAAMAEFMRALRTLKALHAEQAVRRAAGAAFALAAPASRRVARATVAPRTKPDEPERGARRRAGITSRRAAPARPCPAEAAAPWLPDRPETGAAPAAAPARRTNPRPQPLVDRTIAADRAPPRGHPGALPEAEPAAPPAPVRNTGRTP